MPSFRLSTRRRALGLLATMAVLGAGAATAPVAGAATIVPVTASMETVPIPNLNGDADAADDAAIWIHPTDPSLSTIIGTDKSSAGGLVVYDLDGNQLQFTHDGRLNNVDVRYNFPLGASTVSIVGASNRIAQTLDFYRVQVSDRTLVKIGSVDVSKEIKTPRGFSFYHSPYSGRFYAIVTDEGTTAQYELSGAGGTVTGHLVRGPWKVTGPQHTEGLVADDELGRLYLAQEDIGGLLRYGAEPDQPTDSPVVLDRTTEVGGNVVQDIKGLCMYYGSNGEGYVIAISQGGNTFHLYDRKSGAHVGEFKIVDGNGIDAVTGMDGADVTNFGLGPKFPKGMFVSQDTSDPGHFQNFKAVRWDAIANAFSPPLLVDTRFDPRSIGTGSGLPPFVDPATPTPSPTPSPSPTPTPAPAQTPAQTPSGGGGAKPTAPAVPSGASTGGGAITAQGTSGSTAGGGSAAPQPAATAFGTTPGVRAGISKAKGLRARRDGTVRFSILNDNPFRVRASASLSSADGTRLASKVTFELDGRATVKLRLTRHARALLRRKARRVELELVLRDPAGNRRGVWVSFRLRGAARTSRR